MTAALENFSLIKTNNKILFLGDMFELGESAADEHQAIADYAKKLNFTKAILVGENFYEVTTAFKKYKNFKDLAAYLSKTALQKSAILIKGSRGMALERILNHL